MRESGRQGEKKHLLLKAHARQKTDASNNIIVNQPDGVGASAAQAASNQNGPVTKLFGCGENLLLGSKAHKVRPAVEYPWKGSDGKTGGFA
jgi:hypothetical protein